MTSLTRKLLILPPIIIGILIFIMLKSGQQPPTAADDQQTATRVRVQQIEAVDFVPLARGFGEVRPAQVWKAIAQVSGRVEFLHPRLNDGEIIKQGEVLLKIDPVDYQLNLAQAEVQLAELEIELKNSTALLEIEQRNLALAEKEHQRLQKLVKKGSVSRSDADTAERTMLNSRTSVQNLKNTLALYPTNRKLLQVKIEQAQRDLDNTEISAPFNLRVSGMQVEQNQFVSKGEHMFSGDSIQQVEITAQIAMSSIKNLFLNGGMKISGDLSLLNADLSRLTGFKPTVSLDLGNEEPAEWEARFVRISDSVDSETRTMGIVVAVDEPMEKVVPGIRPPLSKGMLVEVSIAGRTQQNSIVVPRSALRNGRAYVADADNKLQIRPLKLLYSQQQYAVIAEGLAAGDRLVLTDLIPAVPGMLLNPVSE
jgi:RND family efflux transporter MFP subunit